MKNNKYGFTLSEVLLSIVIIGVIMSLATTSIKIVKTSYTSLAYFAHKNIVDMVGILYSGAITTSDKSNTDGKTIITDSLIYDGVEGTEVLPPMVTRCVLGGGHVVNVLKHDNEKYSSIVDCSHRETTSADYNLFCKSLATMANTAGKSRCAVGSLSTPISNSSSDPTIEILDLEKPNFVLTNGMRIYISKWDKSSDISADFGYRIIAVDINGKKGPNKLYDPNDTKKATIPPDIITFLVLDNGEVYPLGAVADNIKVDAKRYINYLNAKVKGYYFSSYENRSADLLPNECCKMKKGGVKDCSVRYCNFGVLMLEHKVNSKSTPTFSYRDALCTAKKRAGIGYAGYCKGENYKQNTLCPPSDTSSGSDARAFDLCKVETIKPMFRYNFT